MPHVMPALDPARRVLSASFVNGSQQLLQRLARMHVRANCHTGVRGCGTRSAVLRTHGVFGVSLSGVYNAPACWQTVRGFFVF